MALLLTSIRIAAALLVLVPLTAACGDDDTTATGDSASPSGGLAEREFWSTDVTIDGSPFELVDGTRIQIRFSGEELSASAGCNQLGGTYAIDGDRIVVGDMFMTEMGCEPDLHAQDDLVVRFFGDSPTYVLDADTLTLTATNGDRIELLDKRVAEPDRDLTDGAWEVTGYFDTVTAWSSAIDEPAVLDFRDGTLSGTTACGPIPIAPRLEITGDTLALTGDIPDIGWCGDVDDLTREYVNDLTRVLLNGEPLTVEIDGRTLRLTSPDGLGLTATAAE